MYPKKIRLHLLGIALVFAAAFFGMTSQSAALDTAVVGQPYYGGYGYYGAPYAPYAYPGAFGAYGSAVVDNPNPALAPGPANPFFLNTVSRRGSPLWGQPPASGGGRFMLNNPAPMY